MALETFEIDVAHSGIHFRVRHMVVARVHGRFARWSGTIRLDEENPVRSSVAVHIEAASIDTGVADRDAHLRSADFLHAEQFPEIVFESKRIETVDAAHLQIIGNLTLRDVTREVVLDVEREGSVKDPVGHLRVGFSAAGSLDRRDFGLLWNQVLEQGGVLVGDRVDFEIEVEAVRTGASVRAA